MMRFCRFLPAGLLLAAHLSAAPSIERLAIEVDGLEQPFTQVTGLSIQFPVVEAVASDGTVRQIPGQINQSDLAFLREFTPGPDWYNWTKQVVDGVDYERQVVIRGYDASHRLLVEARLDNAWPFRWEVTAPDAGGVRHERLLLVHELTHVLFQPTVLSTRLLGADVEITYRVLIDVAHLLEVSLTGGNDWNVFQSGLSSPDGILRVVIPPNQLEDFASDRAFFRLRPDDDDPDRR